ncbi:MULTISPECIES: hypothetical protein [unclassified Yoonia]|uniref:hypothetical protein n=1 Tax=unclassified Yoonia TaxID=2629118 RepID=UPI002AFF0FBE|nr:MULTISPECIES: hypothetical protein [unclassified Yoonia]
MKLPNAAHLNPSPIPLHIDYAKHGAGFAAVLAALPGLSDEALALLPHEWVDLPGIIVTLIEDEGLSTEMAAYEAAVPVGLVGSYRALMGI